MTEKHLDAVMEIEKEAFTVPWSRESFEMEITRNKCAYYIVAILDEKVVGYGGMWLVVDEAHITNIAVHRDYRGQGIGKKIIEGLIEEAKRRKLMAMTLEVRASNRVAIHLYEKYGFTPFGRRKGYYSDNNEDAIIMWKYM
ncbi:ribosomal protein S18-alanine N-acetyltransferase [Caldanaerobius fijiensis]